MNPNTVVRAQDFLKFFGELLVDPLIGAPFFPIIMSVLHEVVKQRPQATVAEASVIFFEILAFEEERHTAVFTPQVLLNLFRFSLILRRDTRPTNPEHFSFIAQRIQAGR